MRSFIEASLDEIIAVKERLKAQGFVIEEYLRRQLRSLGEAENQ